MSTTFEVYPCKDGLPSFEALRALAQTRLHEQLALRGVVGVEPDMTMALRSCETNALLPLDWSAPCSWNDDAYLWVSVSGAAGGTDAEFSTVSQYDLDYWDELFLENERARGLEAELRTSLARGHYWSFRRSAGQPAIINFAYGIVAAALAELTNGLLFSDDGGWDYARFPATASEIYQWYFVPGLATDDGVGTWAKTCLEQIAQQA